MGGRTQTPCSRETRSPGPASGRASAGVGAECIHRAGGGSGAKTDAEAVLRGGGGAGARDTGGDAGIRRPPPARPCMRLFAFRPLALRAARSVREDVAEPQAVGQVEQGHHVPRAGAGAAFPPAPHRLGMDCETAVQLRPRQARRLLEPLQALREVVGKGVGSSTVVCSLSRHGNGPAAVRIKTSFYGSVHVVRNRRTGRHGDRTTPSARLSICEAPLRLGLGSGRLIRRAR